MGNSSISVIEWLIAHNEGSSSDPPEVKILTTESVRLLGAPAEKTFSVSLLGEHLSHREVIFAL